MSSPLPVVSIGQVSDLNDLKDQTNKALGLLNAAFVNLTAGMYTKQTVDATGILGSTPTVVALIPDKSLPAIKLIDFTLTDQQLADSAITTRVLLDSAVTDLKIANAAVTDAKVAVNAITTTKIADNAITSPKVIAGAIQTAHMSAGTINADRLISRSITADRIVALAITAGELATDSVTTSKILARNITAAKIAVNTITANEILAGTITSNEIAAHTITAGNILANTITAAEIAATTITAGQIASGTITATQIAATTITGAKIAANTITATNILAGTITASEIASTLNWAQNFVVGTTGLIRGGQSAYNTGSGFWLGYDSGAYKFSIGNSSGSGITYNGTSLLFVGDQIDLGTGVTQTHIDSTVFRYGSAAGARSTLFEPNSGNGYINGLQIVSSGAIQANLFTGTTFGRVSVSASASVYALLQANATYNTLTLQNGTHTWELRDTGTTAGLQFVFGSSTVQMTLNDAGKLTIAGDLLVSTQAYFTYWICKATADGWTVPLYDGSHTLEFKYTSPTVLSVRIDGSTTKSITMF